MDKDLSGLELDDLLSMVQEKSEVVQAVPKRQSAGHIAIIGMAGQVAHCDSLEAFWDLLREGRNARRKLPENRLEDVKEYLRLKGALQAIPQENYLQAAFLSDIASFDHRFFGIAKQEANLMDPNQRLFLQAAWAALEKAGYSGQGIRGSSTGIFVGFSTDFGEDYRRICGTLAPDAPEVAVAGNIKSIIASRLAYHLDLTGPSMLVDTACSSGLVALHLACQAIRNGDCDMALAGAVKTDLIPVMEHANTGVGIKDIQETMASDGLTKTFDDGCEGTSSAEGVLAFLLKPLDAALRDGDTIQAVIRGSAVNQDGQSLGITAPNSAAQERVITHALRNARVHAEDISYIEAHGTATRLGDPIEINGIQRAFRNFTTRRQFCAVGSVKPNIGHMDNAAGLAGLAKVVLSMKHRTLPASLHFRRPNRNIPFEDSPVYVNDSTRPWPSVGDAPLLAGISSFGLSGTNCHVVMESSPTVSEEPPVQKGPFLLALSGKTADALKALAQAYADFVRQERPSPKDVAFTAAVGRFHYNHRLAVLFEDLSDLSAKLDGFVMSGVVGSQVAHGTFRLVNEKGPSSTAQDLAEPERERLNQRAADLQARLAGADRRILFKDALSLYVQGADFDWEGWHRILSGGRRIPLPTYPFAHTRCWVETTPAAEELASRHTLKQFRHPLLDRCVSITQGFRLYQTTLGVDTHWELSEHKVQGSCVLPGTAFLEMMLAVADHLMDQPRAPWILERIVFLSPFVLSDISSKDLHIQVQDQEEGYKLRILSPAQSEENEWDLHAEAELKPLSVQPPPHQDLAALRQDLNKNLTFDRHDDLSRGLEIGDRWNLSFQDGASDLEGSRHLIRLALPEEYRSEASLYHFHPALLDTAVNAANHLVGEGLYLPLSYGRFEAYDRMPAECHVFLRRKSDVEREAVTFDLSIMDLEGRVCAQISDYTIKKVPQSGLHDRSAQAPMHVVRWIPKRLDIPNAALPTAPVLVVRRNDPTQALWSASLQAMGVPIVEQVIDTPSDGPSNPANYLEHQAGKIFSGVIYALCTDADPTKNLEDFFHFVRNFSLHKLRSTGQVLVLTPGAFPVGDVAAQPNSAALSALVRSAALEFPNLRFRCLDSDRNPDGEVLWRELADAATHDVSVHRDGQTYVECLDILPQPTQSRFTAKGEGCYLITGGTGALGLEVAAHLAAKGARAIALLDVDQLPPRETWPTLSSNSDNPKLQRRIQKIMAIEAVGVNMDLHSADVSNESQMYEILGMLRKRHGRILGVIHAAGRAGEGFLLNKEIETFRLVVRPKIDGARILHHLTQEDGLDFFVMFSSIATTLRNPGQGDYTAANAYLESLAEHRRLMKLPATAICWPAWKETGIAVEYGAVDESEFFAPITNASALALLDQVLAHSAAFPPTVILGGLNPKAKRTDVAHLGLELSEALLGTLHQPRKTQAHSGEKVAHSTTHVVLKGLDAPDDIDLAVAQIWARTLAMPELDAEESFTDLGGNSILTTQMYKDFEKVFPGVMEVADLFTHTTIREQAIHVRKALGRDVPTPGSPKAEPDMDAVLAMLANGDISADDAQLILAGSSR